METFFLDLVGGFAIGGLGAGGRSMDLVSVRTFAESVLFFSILKLTTVSWFMAVSSMPFSGSSLGGVMEPGVGGTEDMAAGLVSEGE